MRILIVGNRSHQFITNYVRYLRESLGINDIIIDVLSQESKKKTYLTDSLYDNIFELSMPSFLSAIRFIRGIFKQLIFRYQLVKLSRIQYDITHIHYVENIIKRDAVYFSKKIKGKLIISVWGSDFLRATPAQIEQMLPLFDKASKITIASFEVVEIFKKVYNNCSFISNIAICRFGLQPIEYLIKLYDLKETSSDSKRRMGLLNRVTVSIGYNASKGQQHIDIIHAIESNRLLQIYKDQIEILLPLTYPNDQNYKKKIKNTLANTGFCYRIIEDYLSDDDVAALRNASDIFIQLQKTDMLSGSMLEHLAAGNIVITGSWLPYKSLTDIGAFFLSIDDLQDIGNKLFSILENYRFIKSKTDCNFELIVEKFRWKNVINDWIKVYKE